METFKAEDGMEIHLNKINMGFSVSLKDLDTGKFVQIIEIFKTIKKAKEYVKFLQKLN